jgi:UDP-glucose 4-epimerase
VGRGLLPLLAARGHTGIATGRTVPSDLPPGWIGAARDRVLGDAAEIPRPDGIIHLEVKQHVPRPSAADVAEFDRVNVGGTRAWLDWAGRHGVGRFVFASSIKAVAPSTQPQFEDAPLEPDTPYGLSKARAETLVSEWAAADASQAAVILRPAPVYGPGNEANLAAFVRQIRAGRPCLVGSGATRKAIVSRANLAAALEFALVQARPGVEVFNVSDRETPSLAELARLIAALAGRDMPLTSARLKAIEETSVFPCDKLVAAGFRHPQTTREGLAEMI